MNKAHEQGIQDELAASVNATACDLSLISVLCFMAEDYSAEV